MLILLFESLWDYKNLGLECLKIILPNSSHKKYQITLVAKR